MVSLVYLDCLSQNILMSMKVLKGLVEWSWLLVLHLHYCLRQLSKCWWHAKIWRCANVSCCVVEWRINLGSQAKLDLAWYHIGERRLIHHSLKFRVFRGLKRFKYILEFIRFNFIRELWGLPDNFDMGFRSNGFQSILQGNFSICRVTQNRNLRTSLFMLQQSNRCV